MLSFLTIHQNRRLFAPPFVASSLSIGRLTRSPLVLLLNARLWLLASLLQPKLFNLFICLGQQILYLLSSIFTPTLAFGFLRRPDAVNSPRISSHELLVVRSQCVCTFFVGMLQLQINHSLAFGCIPCWVPPDACV